jgi:hypothetical protein
MQARFVHVWQQCGGFLVMQQQVLFVACWRYHSRRQPHWAHVVLLLLLLLQVALQLQLLSAALRAALLAQRLSPRCLVPGVPAWAAALQGGCMGKSRSLASGTCLRASTSTAKAHSSSRWRRAISSSSSRSRTRMQGSKMRLLVARAAPRQRLKAAKGLQQQTVVSRRRQRGCRLPRCSQRSSRSSSRASCTGCSAPSLKQ